MAQTGNGRERRGAPRNTAPIRKGIKRKMCGNKITKDGEIFGKWQNKRRATGSKPPV